MSIALKGVALLMCCIGSGMVAVVAQAPGPTVEPSSLMKTASEFTALGALIIALLGITFWGIPKIVTMFLTQLDNEHKERTAEAIKREERMETVISNNTQVMTQLQIHCASQRGTASSP